MIQVCIIGISGYGRVHYEHLLLPAQQAGTVKIVGATVINQDEEAARCAHLRELGCELFDDYEAMLQALSGTADLCLIPTGTPLHCTMTVAALNAGMHVLVEKPAAGCIDDVRAMQDAADRAGRLVAVGYQQMYAPLTMTIKQQVLGGAIGTLEAIKCLVMWPRNHAYYARNGWAGRLSVAGTAVHDSPFNNAVAHDLMMSLFQAGATEASAATPVSVTGDLYRANAIESLDTACLQIETEEGVPIRFYATHACQEVFGPEIHLRGTGGTIVMTHNGAVIRRADGEEASYRSEGTEGARQSMMSAVLDAIRGGSSFICGLDLASRQTMVVSAVHESCEIHPVEGHVAAPSDGPALTYIPGIEAALRTAFDQEQPLSDLHTLCG